MNDTEPLLATLLEERKARRGLPPYLPQEDRAVAALLQSWYDEREPGANVRDVARMGGGASREQFIFTLERDGTERRYILRMDPTEGITETSRAREYEILRAFEGTLPVPAAVWLDIDADHFPCPAMIVEVVAGVTKPTSDQLSVTGLGTILGDPLRDIIRPQFLGHLATIHNFDWSTADLPSFTAPTDDPKQPTRWLIQFWKELLEQDAVTKEPVLRLATQWLEDNVPDCEKISVVHGDYRTGNYLFEEADGRITAILDWEMCYLGDLHADLAWAIQPVFGSHIDGVFRGSDLAPPAQFLAEYEAASGNRVDPAKLHYFTMFNAWKSYILVAALGVRAARQAHNHQDVLLTFLAATGPLFVDELARLLMMEESQ
ncbi:MAG: phosphotransferase family protein [Sphingopyxis sp.]|jgi:aminoglycoside phosphotransferase (APT) family kinase protein|uniref:phosphotransferase family protein n=1 Tax=Sphingopyxis sp. TaxID=1908224 RepID=UPI001A48AE86|nr:phosphotransferase family protein [Sphingopyxis sp.]MBL9070525.1 phosphotransferase family protein [Sphingopyxis sp.]HEV7310898.1 phosphotransferase family protein [Sphingopyxis sp.]